MLCSNKSFSTKALVYEALGSPAALLTVSVPQRSPVFEQPADGNWPDITDIDEQTIIFTKTHTKLAMSL